MKPIHVLIIITSFISILLASCSALPTEEPPGVGEKAELGYATCAPVIAALEQYKADKGFYPDALAELVLDYVSAVPTKDEVLDFSYRKTEVSFAFSFHYIGPGMNTCTYTPENQWQCSGAF